MTTAKTESASVIFILMTGAFLLFGPSSTVHGLAFGHSCVEGIAVGGVLQQENSSKQDEFKAIQDEEPKKSTKPPTVQEQGARDESALPSEAFNPMKLYEINAEGDASATSEGNIGPTVDPLVEGVIHWPYLTVNVTERYIDIEGVIGINEGFLEQVVCLPGTRGYESLVIGFARPSHIHAALLLLGLEQGKPGKWVAVPPKAEDENWTYQVVPPEGAKVRVTIIYEKAEADPDEATETGVGAELELSESAEMLEVPVRDWVVDYRTGKIFPEGPWVFGGSAIKKDFTDTERYVADLTGSIIGIVTFGDEILGWNEVWPDQDEVLEPEWVCNTKKMPAWNTRVVVRIRPWLEAEKAEDDATNAEAGKLQESGGN